MSDAAILEPIAAGPPRSRQFLVKALLVLCAALLPVFVGDAFALHLAIQIMLNAILVLSLVVIARFGQLSVCPAAFAGIGGYCSALLSAEAGVPFVLAAAAGLVLALAVAIVLGLLILKLRGAYFVLTTFIVGQIINLLILDFESVTGGTVGVANIPSPNVLGFSASSKSAFYYLALISLLLAYLVVQGVARSHLGRACRALDLNLKLAESCGIPTRLAQLSAFVISCAIAALGGILMAHYYRYIAPQNFDFWLSVSVLVMLVVGGRRSAFGACLGAAVMTLLPEIVRSSSEWQHILYGIVVLAMLRFVPGGLASLLERSYGRPQRSAK